VNRETALQYRIESIPTVILFRKGAVVQKFVGLRREADYKQALDAEM
jgi:thioredoxin-like negative regulator of GroEL